jgi:CRP-like cAMP-binding protein
MSAPAKIVKKGEVLFKEGDKITSIQVIQAGSVNICLSRSKKNIDIATVGSSHALGEQGIFGQGAHSFTAIAAQETKVTEIPIEAFKQAVENSTPMVKVLAKSMSDRLKTSMAELKSLKMEKDTTPCPEDQVAKAFGVVFHTANHKGAKDAKEPKKVSIDYTLYKQYSQRVFGESPKRLESVLSILVKLKLASFEMGRPPEDPEGPEMIMKVNLFDISAIEAFFEFYQYFYFKGVGKGEVLKFDESCFNLLNVMVSMCEKVEADRFGVVTLEYPAFIEKLKTDLGVTLNPGHFDRLEQKGVIVKRKTQDNGPALLQFEIKEFRATLNNWKMLREIDRWNEKGVVDMSEEAPKAKKTEGPCCPQCSAGIVAQAKFCSECGFKIAA